MLVTSSFMPIPLKHYRCLDHVLKMCILFEYNPRKKFCLFFHKLNFAIFSAKVNGFKVVCIGNSFDSFMPISLKLCRC